VAALALLCSACPTLDLGESPPGSAECNPSFTYYRDTLWPQYLAPADEARSCVGGTGCHADASGRSNLRLDATAPVNHTANYGMAIRFINCASLDTSPLLTKPLAEEEDHGGGDLFGEDSGAVDIFLEWFNH